MIFRSVGDKEEEEVMELDRPDFTVQTVGENGGEREYLEHARCAPGGKGLYLWP